MTVSELIEKLEKLPGDNIVIIDEPEQNNDECNIVRCGNLPVYVNDEIIGYKSVIFVG